MATEKGKENEENKEVEETEEQILEEVPEKLRGKDLKETLKNVARGYKEAEKGFHRKSAEVIKLQTYADLLPQREEIANKSVGEGTGLANLKEEYLKNPFEVTARLLDATYQKAYADSVQTMQTAQRVREGIQGYLDTYPYLKKVGKLFQSEVMGRIQQNPQGTLFDVFEEAREAVDAVIKEAGGKKEDKKPRTLEGTGGKESLLAGERKEKEADEKENEGESLEDYIANRQRKFTKVT